MEIRFEIDPEELTTDDMLLIEDVQGNTKPFHAVVAVLSRFMADSNGVPMPQDAARAALGKLKMRDLNRAAEMFVEAIQRKAVPPKISGG